jgi:hypothetical protein
MGPTMKPFLPTVPVMEPWVVGEQEHPMEEPEMDPEDGPGLSAEVDPPEMEQSRAPHHTKLVACGGEPVVQWKQPQ